MRIKVKIVGTVIHGVGYRQHLLDLAIRHDIDRFSVKHSNEGGMQAVIACVEGNEDTINNFIDDVRKEIPEEAEVSSINYEQIREYVSPIMATAWGLMSKESG